MHTYVVIRRNGLILLIILIVFLLYVILVNFSQIVLRDACFAVYPTGSIYSIMSYIAMFLVTLFLFIYVNLIFCNSILLKFTFTR